MEKITLEGLLQKSQEQKKINKWLGRAIKTYRHAMRDLAHVRTDIAHATEDCQHAIQTYTQILDDHEEFVVDWANGDEDPEIVDEIPESAPESAPESEIILVDEDDDEAHGLIQAEEDLEHASRDFSNAFKDAKRVMEDLLDVEVLLLEVIELAEEEGYTLSLKELKTHVIDQAKARDAQKAAES